MTNRIVGIDVARALAIMGMIIVNFKIAFGDNEVEYLFASGNGGNHLIVIPDEEMVIALTSSAYGQRYAHRRSYNIMSKILASLK